jgi:hypothetical protein
MSSISLYEASVPQFNRVMKALKGVLTKAEAHATAKKLDPSALLLARLYPDMFHTAQQIGTATTMVHWGCAMIAGEERPTLPPPEASFAALQARLQATVDFAAKYGPDKLNGREDQPVQIKFPTMTLDFTAKSFLFEFILPNLYFHAAMTYGILRHNGVELGKQDFLARG